MIFTTKKGTHYSNQLFYKFLNCLQFSNTLTYKVTFTNSCEYFLNKEDQLDVNKLFGFSSGLHHTNSARFGWNYEPHKINLWAYYYINGKRDITYVDSLIIGTEYQLSIESFSDKYNFIVFRNGRKKIVSIHKSIEHHFGYKLWPYFGGNNTAPHDIAIKMSQVH